MIDIGANLSHQSFQDDLENVLTNAKTANVEQVIVTGTNVEGSQQALALAKRFPGYLSCTAGIHPHDASEFNLENLTKLKELSSDSKVVALGETGLDFHRNYSPQDKQEESFAAQLDLAIELQMPVFLHQRDAHERFMKILEPRLKDLSKVVVHCFTGTEEELKDYLAHDLYIGITGWVCDERRGHHLHPLLKLIPENRLMIETDSPYLMPRNIHPKPKGRRNEPANLSWVLKTVAECLNESPDTVAANTRQTTKNFFNLS